MYISPTTRRIFSGTRTRTPVPFEYPIKSSSISSYGPKKAFGLFLRGRIIGRLECGRTQLEVSEELGIAQSVISMLWQRFQDDGNVSRCYSTGHHRDTTPNEDRYIWQLLPKETDGAQHHTCLVSFLQLPLRQFQSRPCTNA
ncbi:uncharacterized protein TNCV_2932601 [Trichonephila clavipes]|nr:uncharacterized protein TNCV_2932601 [Trichonephila clavipes]